MLLLSRTEIRMFKRTAVDCLKEKKHLWWYVLQQFISFVTFISFTFNLIYFQITLEPICIKRVYYFKNKFSLRSTSLRWNIELYNWFHIITERRARGDLNLDDAYDELFRLLECLLHPIRSLEQLWCNIARGDWAIKATALVYLLYTIPKGESINTCLIWNF